jgi:outer membrane cobalamin receptor
LARKRETDGGRNTIVVTALKRTQDLQDVPMAITALGEQALDDLQINELRDAAKFLPSVTIQSSGAGFSQIYFRGVASGENANHSASLPTVGVYLDEMPVTTIQGSLDIHTYDLNRIEALAGPQGTLYGASSMSGTVKLITNPPEPGETYGTADVELNTVSHGDIGGIGETMYNFGISDTAALRAGGLVPQGRRLLSTTSPAAAPIRPRASPRTTRRWSRKTTTRPTRTAAASRSASTSTRTGPCARR